MKTTRKIDPESIIINGEYKIAKGITEPNKKINMMNIENFT